MFLLLPLRTKTIIENQKTEEKYQAEINEIITSKADSDREISEIKEQIRLQNEKVNSLKTSEMSL